MAADPQIPSSDRKTAMDERLKAELLRIMQDNITQHPLVTEALAPYLKAMKSGTKVGLYGCGFVAKALMAHHADCLDHLDACFVLTEPKGEAEFMGHPVMAASELESSPPEHVILLSSRFERDMAANLPFLPPTSLVTLSQVVEVTGLETLAENVMVRIQQHAKAAAERILKELPAGKELVIFFTHRAPQHMIKIIREVRKLGFAVLVVVDNLEITSAISLADYANRGYFHGLYEARYNAALELLELEKYLKPYVVHAETAMWSNVPLAYVVEEIEAPIAVEYRDFIQTVFRSKEDAAEAMRLSLPAYERELEAQRRVYTGADGIIMKDSPEVLDFLEAEYQYRPDKVLSFLHYFGDEWAGSASLPKFSEETGEIHIVYAGGVVNDPHWHNYPIYRSLLEAGQMLAAQHIHLDIYNAGDSTGQGFQEYRDLSDLCPYFHYHPAIPYAELKEILPRYDFGWFCFDFEHAREAPFFLKITMGSKVFTYLEAGLPTLVSPEQEFISETITEKLGVGISVGFRELPRLNEILRATDWERVRVNIKTARQEWTYDRNAGRLGAFYAQLAAEGKS